LDIFTNVLTRVVPVPIKPEKLRVKALTKEPSVNPLTDDVYHLENHDYFYLIKEKEHKQKKKQNKQQHSSITQEDAENIIPAEDVIIHKDEILHPKEQHAEADDDTKHLDIFV